MTTTEQPPQKRLRFSNDEPTTESTTQRPTPSVAARNYVSESVRSLPDSVQKYIISISTAFHKLKNKERQQQKNQARFDDDDFIPRSARIGFELKGSEAVMETEQFKTLATTTSDEIKKLQKILRANMLSTIKLEIAHTQELILNTFFKGVKELGSLFYLLSHPNTTAEQVPTHAIARYLLEKQRGSLFKHVNVTDDTKFQKYLTYAQDEVVHTPGTTPANCITPFTKVSDKIQPILEEIFVNSWETLVNEIDERTALSKINQQIREFEVSQATQDTAMQIDTEQALNHTTISNLIQEEVSKNVKKLHTELNQLGQRIQRNGTQPTKTKNKPRGAPNRAPSTKKSATAIKPTKRTQRRHQPSKKDSTDASDNDSSKGSAKTKKKTPNGKKGNYKKNSKTQSRR